MCIVEVSDVAEMWSVVEYLARFPAINPPNTITIYLLSKYLLQYGVLLG